MPEDTAMVSENTEEKKPRKRGRQKGVLLPPRDIFVVCVGQVPSEDDENENIVVADEIQVEGDKTSDADDLLRQAQEKFEEKYDTEALIVRGPYFQRKGGAPTGNAPGRRRTARFDINDLEILNRRITAVYEGWQVTGRYVRDPEAKYVKNQEKEGVLITFQKEVSPSEKKKTKPATKLVEPKDLENIQDQAS